VDALVCSQPGSLELVQMPDPPADPDAVLVRPRRVGICGTDYHIYEGKHPYLKYPRIMGHELAAEAVEAPAGSGVTPGQIYVVNPYLSCGHCIACRAGKSNCCVSISVLGVHQDGGMAELLSLPAANLIRAEGLPADECASVEFLSIGAHAVRRSATSNGDKVLVVGTGPIGLGVALFARLAGAAVAIFDREAERASAAQSITGATPLSSVDNLLQSVSAFTKGDGFDVVFDATGSSAAMKGGFDLVAHGGRYVLVSVIKDSITFSDPDFHRKEMTLFGSRNATTEDFEAVIAAIRDGRVPVDRLITHRTSLKEAVRDIPVWATQKTGLIKAIIEID
jgi:2-desacetyl-2-hydroxyethyl bacteriochlorophyllide A dehydrogenase